MIPYPKPSAPGGVLIRKVMALAKARGLSLPLRDPVLIAVSGGVDSMVLAHLLGRYGRNFIHSEKITLLHLDHGWRPDSAEVERRAVEQLAARLGVAHLHRRLEPPASGPGVNAEEDARNKRNRIYDELAGEGRPWRHVLTAHHRDDVSESIFWRFLRGEFDRGREGVLFMDCQCLRPFLQVTKEEIRLYAAAEQVPFHEDPGNADPRQFRAWMRTRVFPLLEEAFPAIRETVASYALREPVRPRTEGGQIALENLLEAMNRAPLNRAQREALTRMLEGASPGGVLLLSGGVQLKRLKNGWLLENPESPIQA